MEPLTNPCPEWAKQISGWSVPGRFAFFVFRIDVDYYCPEWFPGLETHWEEAEPIASPVVLSDGSYSTYKRVGLFVGGTVAQWDSACYALLNRDSPHDCCVIYRKIHTMLSIGFDMRGERTSQAKKFYLQ